MNEIIINLTLLGQTPISQLSASTVLYLILVSFWKNRHFHYGAKSWNEVIRQLDLGFIDEIIIDKYYQRKPKFVKYIVLFLFFCWLLDIPRTQMLAFLEANKNRFWFRYIPAHNRFYKAVSDFLGSVQNVDQKDLDLCFEKIIEQIFRIVRVDKLTDADLFNYSRVFTFRNNLGLPENAKGGHYFANFIFSLGMGAALALCQKDGTSEKRFLTGFGYSTTDLVCTILSTLGTKNISQLAKEVKNNGAFHEGLSPSSQVLGQFVDKLDKDKIVSFYERFVQSVRKFKKLSKVVIAIDATIIEIFGDYEGAEWVWDHDLNKYVRGYKLYLAFDVTNSVPVGFLLAGSESECTKLLDLVESAKRIVGAENVEFTVFDRGYFDTARFAKLDDEKGENSGNDSDKKEENAGNDSDKKDGKTNNDHFVTLGKKCKTFKDIIAIFEKDLSLYEKIDEKEWRVTFYLADFINFTRENGMRWARVTIRRQLITKTKRDKKTGEIITETKVEHLIYITNIRDGSVEDIVKTYGQRVAIENFFEEFKNAYYVKGFPKRSRDGVIIHITLTLIAHQVLWLFCSLLASKDEKHPHPYRNKELTSLKFDLLERPAEDIFDLSEPFDPDILKVQSEIEKDVAFIRNFRRFVQRTKKKRIKISLMDSILA